MSSHMTTIAQNTANILMNAQAYNNNTNNSNTMIFVYID